MGGGCRLPMVKSQLQKAFPGAQFLSSINPDEVVAIGAAKEAGILIAGEEEERDQNERETRVPCLPGDILVEVSTSCGLDYGTGIGHLYMNC